MTPRTTLAVRATCRSSQLTHSQFVAQKTKDAVVDALRDRFGDAPVGRPRRSGRAARPAPRARPGDALPRRRAAPRSTSAAGARGPAPLPCARRSPRRSCASPGGTGSGPSSTRCAAPGRSPSRRPRGRAGSRRGWRATALRLRALGEPRRRGAAGDATSCATRRAPSDGPMGRRCCASDVEPALGAARARTTRGRRGWTWSSIARDVRDLAPLDPPGFVVTNPPYGERLAADEELYGDLATALRADARPHGRAARRDAGHRRAPCAAKPDRWWVLYNGPIECRLLVYAHPLSRSTPQPRRANLDSVDGTHPRSRRGPLVRGARSGEAPPVRAAARHRDRSPTRTAFVSSFANATAFDTDEGLVLVDTGSFLLGRAGPRRASARSRTRPCTRPSTRTGTWTTASASSATRRSRARPARVVAHERVPARFERYRLTHGYNACINARQFRTPPSWPVEFRAPDVTYAQSLDVDDRRRALRAAARAGGDGRRDLGVGPVAGGRVRGGPVHLGDAERRQPAEGAALPARVGAGAADDRGAAGRDALPGPRPAHLRPRPRAAGAHRDRGAARVARRADARRHERRGAPGRRARDGAGPGRAARAPLPAPRLRRAGVHRAQRLAPLRRLVGRRPVAPQAGPRAPRSPREIAALAGGARKLADRAAELADARRLRARLPPRRDGVAGGPGRRGHRARARRRLHAASAGRRRRSWRAASTPAAARESEREDEP